MFASHYSVAEIAFRLLGKNSMGTYYGLTPLPPHAPADPRDNWIAPTVRTLHV
jgi:hypothetical protein